MSPDGDDDPTDGGTPKCNAAWDAYTEAEEDWEKARDELHDAEFDNEVEFEWMMMTCEHFGEGSDQCIVEMLSALEAVRRLKPAREAAAAARRARDGAAYLVVDCLSDHKFRGNVWLPE
jgi:hypothetical protein